jgi:RimJ/RimL family protein N-acetyltransferase
MFIRSERLFLRPGWPEDWQELHARIGDEGVVRNLASAPWPYTAEDARDFVGKSQDERCPHFLVTLPTSKGPAELIGGVGLGRIDGEVELGYWISRAHWGQGYATEASRAVLSLARTLGHRQIVSGHFIDNPASGAVLRKVGFTPTGRVRQRHSLARGYDAQSVEYRLDLGERCDCDDGEATKRAA